MSLRDKLLLTLDGRPAQTLSGEKLARQLGLAVGISSGANFLGALQIQNEMGADAVVTTVFSDCNKKYLSTDLMREEPVRDNCDIPNIELVDFKVYKRVCDTCCDMYECELKTCEFKRP